MTRWAFEQIMKFRNVLNNIDKRLLSVHEGASRLNLSESVLASAEQIIQRSKEIALGQNNGTSSAAEREGVAQEVHQLLLSFLDAANTKINERYLFSGFETQTATYALSTSVSASGRSPCYLCQWRQYGNDFGYRGDSDGQFPHWRRVFNILF